MEEKLEELIEVTASIGNDINMEDVEYSIKSVRDKIDTLIDLQVQTNKLLETQNRIPRIYRSKH